MRGEASGVTKGFGVRMRPLAGLVEKKMVHMASIAVEFAPAISVAGLCWVFSLGGVGRPVRRRAYRSLRRFIVSSTSSAHHSGCWITQVCSSWVDVQDSINLSHPWSRLFNKASVLIRPTRCAGCALPQARPQVARRLGLSGTRRALEGTG